MLFCCGAYAAAQVIENLACLGLPLSAEAVAEMERATDGAAPVSAACCWNRVCQTASCPLGRLSGVALGLRLRGDVHRSGPRSASIKAALGENLDPYESLEYSRIR